MSQPRRIVLVFDNNAGQELSRLAEGSHVWVVRSESNEQAARALWATRSTETTALGAGGVTVFARNEADAVAALGSALESIEDHHGDHAQHPPAEEIVILGLEWNADLESVLREWGYGKIEAVDEEVRGRRG